MILAMIFIDFGLLRSPYCKMSYLLTLRYLFKFDNLHVTDCVKIIVGFMANVGNVFYQTFTNVFFIFFSTFLTFFNVFYFLFERSLHLCYLLKGGTLQWKGLAFGVVLYYIISAVEEMQPEHTESQSQHHQMKTAAAEAGKQAFRPQTCQYAVLSFHTLDLFITMNDRRDLITCTQSGTGVPQQFFTTAR